MLALLLRAALAGAAAFAAALAGSVNLDRAAVVAAATVAVHAVLSYLTPVDRAAGVGKGGGSAVR